MNKIDITKVSSIIAEVAAKEIMPRFRKLALDDVEMKGVNDPVTVADKITEQVLTSHLTKLVPGSVVVGEESFAIDSSIISHFGNDKHVWVIDPIDGTRNFIAGIPEFGVMVALVHNKKTIGAWIHDPNTGDTLSAEEGSGVWLRGKKMRLAGQDPAIPKLGIIGSRMKKILVKLDTDEVRKALPKLVKGSAAAFDYARLFDGDVLFADSKESRVAFLFYRQSKPWDHVPGLFLHSEAGGYAADFAANPYNLENAQKSLLVAPDKASWAEFHAPFKRALDGVVF